MLMSWSLGKIHPVRKRGKWRRVMKNRMKRKEWCW
jgi:hypothetical protein